jgi:hypothetical protein
MTHLQWHVDDVAITRVVESEMVLPPEQLLSEATADRVARHRAWVTPDFADLEGNLRISTHALLVASQGKRIVVDTCVGNRTVPQFEMRVDTPFLGHIAGRVP